MSNRNYLPVEGRFSTPDPAGLMAADPSNPQTWNLYAYVTNNPLTNTDPTGLGQPPRIIMETPVTGACEIPSNQAQAICQGGWGFPFLGDKCALSGALGLQSLGAGTAAQFGVVSAPVGWGAWTVGAATTIYGALYCTN